MSEVENLQLKELLNEPCVLGIEHGALICNAGSGRVRLFALTDLIDVDEVKRQQADEEMRQQLERLELESDFQNSINVKHQET